MELKIHLDPAIPGEEVYVISGPEPNSPITILVHPATHLRMDNPHSPMWSKKTLGHREAERDKRRVAKGWHNNAYFYG